MLRFLCPDAVVPFHIPETGSRPSCDVVRSFSKVASSRPAAALQSFHNPVPNEVIQRHEAPPPACRCHRQRSCRTHCQRRGQRRGHRHHHLQLGAAGGIPPEFYRPMPGQGVPNAMSVPGYALVRDDREMQIKQGRSQLSFTDVAALIDPTTVTFASLTDPATRVLEQNFQFDLVSTQKLLLKFIDARSPSTRTSATASRRSPARCSRPVTAWCCAARTGLSTPCRPIRR